MAFAIGCIGVLAPIPAEAQRLSDVSFEATAQTDALAPDQWSNGRHGARLAAGATIARLYLFGFLDAAGNEQSRIAPGTDLFVISGMDTTFVLPVASSVPGAVDSIPVHFPAFARWDEGPTNPFSRSDTTHALARATYAFPGGSDVGLSYRGARRQELGRELEHLYNFQGWLGALSIDHEINVDGRVVLRRSAESTLAMHVDARHVRSRHEAGIPNESDPDWDTAPSFGFDVATLDFLAANEMRYDERLALAIRSDLIRQDQLALFFGAYEMAPRQSVASYSLRLNPYGIRTSLPIAGLPSIEGMGYASESDVGTRVAASLERQRGESHLLTMGVDRATNRVETLRLPMFAGRAIMQRVEPERLGAWITNRTTLAQLDVEMGVRFDRIDTDAVYPRVPGFVWFLPDSLRGDAWYDPGPSGLGDTRTVPERMQPFPDCFGNVPCLDNFLDARVQTGWSPHVALGARLTDISRFRVSYGEVMNGPGAPPGRGAEIDALAWTSALTANATGDFAGGTLSTSSPFGRDVDLPRTRVTEARLVYGFSPALSVDVGAFRRTVLDGLAWRHVTYTNPIAGNEITLNTLVNRDAPPVEGVNLHLDWRVGELTDVALGYAYRDVGGLDGEPLLHQGLPSATAAVPGLPSRRPEEGGFGPASDAERDEHRRHTLEGTVSLLLPSDRGGILSDVGVLTTVRAASGLPYTRLANQAIGLIGPPMTGLGTLASGHEDRTPWVTWLELRVHKGFAVVGGRLRAFVQWSGPLGANQSQVWLETGRARNDEHRFATIASHMADATLDGSFDIRGFWVGDCVTTRVLCEVPEEQGALNAYSLAQAEILFGDRDGFFSVEEQERAFGAWYDAFFGSQWLRRSDRSLRFGLELRF